MKNSKSTKPVKAWAVMELDTEIQAVQFDYRGNKHYVILPSRAEAQAWDNMKQGYKIIPVLISPLKKKKVRK